MRESCALERVGRRTLDLAMYRLRVAISQTQLHEHPNAMFAGLLRKSRHLTVLPTPARR
jgi:hypothetical protein